MRVDHRGFDIGVAEVFLDLPDVDASEQQMRRERVAQRVNRHRLVDARGRERGRWADEGETTDANRNSARYARLGRPPLRLFRKCEDGAPAVE